MHAWAPDCPVDIPSSAAKALDMVHGWVRDDDVLVAWSRLRQHSLDHMMIMAPPQNLRANVEMASS